MVSIQNKREANILRQKSNHNINSFYGSRFHSLISSDDTSFNGISDENINGEKNWTSIGRLEHEQLSQATQSPKGRNRRSCANVIHFRFHSLSTTRNIKQQHPSEKKLTRRREESKKGKFLLVIQTRVKICFLLLFTEKWENVSIFIVLYELSSSCCCFSFPSNKKFSTELNLFREPFALRHVSSVKIQKF